MAVLNPFSYLERNAGDSPAGAFLISAERTITNAEAFELTKKLAYEFRRLGVKPGDVVALDLPEVLGGVFTMAAFHEAAASTILPTEAVQGAVRSFDWLFTSGEVGAPGESTHVVRVDDRFIANVEQNPFGISPRDFPSELSHVRIVYSSGTTGRPKAIGYPLGMAEIQIQDLAQGWGATVSLFGLGALQGFLQLYMQLKLGEPFLSAGGLEPDAAVELCARQSVTTILGSPAQIAGVAASLESQDRTLPGVRAVVVNGTVLPVVMSRRISLVMPNSRVVNVYGATESGMIALRPYPSDDPFDAGQLNPESRVEIVDEHDQVVAAGVTGRIRAQHPHMVTEYLSDPLAANESFHDGWFYPGDLGFIRPEDNGLTLIGRASDIINAGGVKIDPIQLDLFALKQENVIDAASFSYRESDGLLAVGMALVTRDDIDVDALVSSLKAEFGPAAPRIVARVEAIPRTENGKPQRNILAEKYSGG
ncbi:MAG TPA: long-chain fatty acid--CoA ligase [Galbitalea sp.]|nr:long-chain fatty acid--CoA ligase [Galbitalea sp.]